MYVIDYKATDKTPKIFLDTEENYFEISGYSRPENINDFYNPVLNTLRSFFEPCITKENSLSSQFNFNFKLEYFNSSSSKFILDILQLAQEYILKHVDIVINWYYEDDDEDMFETGQDFSSMVHIPFNFIKIKIQN